MTYISFTTTFFYRSQAFPRVELSNCDASLTSLAKCLLRPIIAEDVFNLLQDAVFNKLENHSSFYAKFKKQEAYVQLLADFDLLHGEGGSEDGGSCRGKVDADGISITSVESCEFSRNGGIRFRF